MVKVCLGFSLSFLLFSCGGSAEKMNDQSIEKAIEYNAEIGIGKFVKVELEAVLDQSLSKKGEELQGQKCASCHKLTDEVSIGPGWRDVTKKRSPEWLLNLMTNTEEMLKIDPSLIEQTKKFGISMPNPNLTDEEAKAILEFMRSNDEVR